MKNCSTRFLVTRPLAARGRTRGGAAVLEMTLVLFLLLTLTFGTIEFGDAFFKKNTLQGAAREGAREAIIAGSSKSSTEAAIAAVLQQAANLKPSQYTVTIIDHDSKVPIDFATVPAGRPIRVTVEANWGTIGLRPMGLMDATKTISGTAVMRREG
ncbi:MAG TPA: TadE/TadG family type IV pilus assembly protein [Tepidisphaeraceae bacterium]|jgi:Flp pilus assembly protein TadG|nr:TadE/TadG family type IV pilus assembly protein [Tepidisphaeraceae bacterium]